MIKDSFDSKDEFSMETILEITYLFSYIAD